MGPALAEAESSPRTVSDGDPSGLVGGQRIAANSLLTLITGLLLLAASVAVVPFAIDAFGRELYGLLTITWMLSAHLSWLDFGLSRASARFVARDLADGERTSAAAWGWTALQTQLAMGVAGALALWLLAPILVDALKVDASRHSLAIFTVRTFALAMPLSLATRSMVGILQAGQRFKLVNLNNLAFAVATYSAYGIGILLDDNFRVVVWGLFAAQLMSFALVFGGATRVVPLISTFRATLRRHGGYGPRLVEMLRFGSWVAVATLLGPLLLYFDQWIIGIVLGVAILPYYTIPFTLLSRLDLLPSSLTQTLFPAFSSLQAREQWGQIGDFFVRAHRYLLLALIPTLFLVYVWGDELLRVWVGADFAEHAATPLRILICGVIAGLLAPLSGALLQGIGRPDVIGKLYAVELPFNVALVLVLTKTFGLSGAAASFAIRTILETLVLWYVVGRVVRFDVPAQALLVRTARQTGLLLGAMAVAALLVRSDGLTSIAVTIGVLAVYAVAVASRVLDRNDKLLMLSLLRRAT